MKQIVRLGKTAGIFCIDIVVLVTGLIAGLLGSLAQKLQLRKFWLEFKQRPDDIYIATFMRSGTTWIQMILHQLTSDGNMEFSDIFSVSPSFENVVIGSSAVESLPSPRFFKSHAVYDFLARCKHAKFIYVMRDGRDVALSQYHYLKPIIMSPDELTFDESFKRYFINVAKKKSFMVHKDGWFGYMADWLANKKNLNILYLRYEDLKEDLEGNIRKIAAFCGLTVNESEWPRILERCQFGFMKKYQRKFDGRISNKNPFRGEINDTVRAGKIKEGENYFSREQQEVYACLYDRYLGRFNLKGYQPSLLK